MITIQQETDSRPRGVFDSVVHCEKRPHSHPYNTVSALAALAFFIALTFVLAACGDSGANDLRGTAWELASLSGSGLLPGTSITIEFSDDGVSGSAGCNHYWGSYQVSGNSLTMSDVFSTEMGCPEPLGILEQEGVYLAALNVGDSYQFAGDQLEIFDEVGKRVLVFAKSAGVSTPQADEPSDQPDELETVEKLAPIDRIEILAAQSFPPRYFLLVESGLRNSCTEFDRHEVKAEGNMLDVTIINRETVGVPCTEEYRTVVHNIALGSDFELGTTYTVQVNDEAETFVTHDAVPTPDIDSTLTPEVVEETPSPAADPPPGFKQYEDSKVGVSVFLPESWAVTQVVPGQSAILQSYSETKYVGGEALDLADTKCDLTNSPPDVDVTSYIQQLRSNSTVTIVSEDEIVLQSGRPGIRIEVESMGRSISLVTSINERVVVLTCFGELTPFDEFAVTLRAVQ